MFFFLPLMFWVCMCSEILPNLLWVCLFVCLVFFFFNADLYIFLDLWV